MRHLLWADMKTTQCSESIQNTGLDEKLYWFGDELSQLANENDLRVQNVVVFEVHSKQPLWVRLFVIRE